MEALEFFKGNKNKFCFASNHFNGKRYALAFVKRLYKLGAKNVEVSNILDEDWRLKEEGGPYADTFIVTLPKDKSKRLNLVAEIFEERPDEVSSRPGYIKKVDWNEDDTVSLWWD